MTKGLELESRLGQEFSLMHVFQTGPGADQHPIQWVPGTLSPGVKRLLREAGYSPPTSAEVKSDNFTFYALWQADGAPPQRTHWDAAATTASLRPGRTANGVHLNSPHSSAPYRLDYLELCSFTIIPVYCILRDGIKMSA
jgi:hypothetical protein